MLSLLATPSAIPTLISSSCLIYTQPAVALACYDIASANDSEERDPFAWELEGWTTQGAGVQSQPSRGQEGAGQWVVLDTQSGVLFDARKQLRTFWVQPGGAVGALQGGAGAEPAGGVQMYRREGAGFKPAGAAEGQGVGSQGAGSAAPLTCTAWRLKVQRTRHPASANCVQLATFRCDRTAYTPALLFRWGRGVQTENCRRYSNEPEGHHLD